MITELVIGYLVPGKPVAMMLFKTYGLYTIYTAGASTYSSLKTGYISAAQGLAFARDLKLGHYLKVPPRSMFWAQVVATVVAGTAQLGVQLWLFARVKNFCHDDQEDGFTCPGYVTSTLRSPYADGCSQHTDVWDGVYHLGSHRAKAQLLGRRHILRVALFLSHRRLGTYFPMAVDEEIQELGGPLYQFPRYVGPHRDHIRR